MRVRYLYSACLEIETPDLRILTDPWFTDGAYDGSWHPFPKLKDPLETLREPDLIYVSHIHPDHYDPRFLHQLFDRYGEKPVLIPAFERNFLELKARADGIDVASLREADFGATRVAIVPNVTGSASDVDSALVVHAEGQTFVNLNDCAWNDAHVVELRHVLGSVCDEIDLLALGYTGAGPYPQTYFDLVRQHDELLTKAEAKKQEFFGRYRRYCDALPARCHLPFAGKYLLGGRLAPLNPFRGVADAVEVLDFDPRAIVLADGGDGEIDLGTLEATAVRTTPYSQQALDARIREIATLPLDYETEITIPYERIAFARLLKSALRSARPRSEVAGDYWFVIHIEQDERVVESFRFNVKRDATDFTPVSTSDELPEPRSEYFVDYRHLFGCLTALYHWNNSEIGSFVRVRRSPDTFDRSAQQFLNFLCCA